jgi:hypothetical protein
MAICGFLVKGNWTMLVSANKTNSEILNGNYPAFFDLQKTMEENQKRGQGKLW